MIVTMGDPHLVGDMAYDPSTNALPDGTVCTYGVVEFPDAPPLIEWPMTYAPPPGATAVGMNAQHNVGLKTSYACDTSANRDAKKKENAKRLAISNHDDAALQALCSQPNPPSGCPSYSQGYLTNYAALGLEQQGPGPGRNAILAIAAVAAVGLYALLR